MTAEAPQANPADELRRKIRTQLISPEFRTLGFLTQLDRLEIELADQKQSQQAIMGELNAFAGMAYQRAQDIGNTESVEAFGARIDAYNRRLDMLGTNDVSTDLPEKEVKNEQPSPTELKPEVPVNVNDETPKKRRGRPPKNPTAKPSNTESLPRMTNRK